MFKTKKVDTEYIVRKINEQSEYYKSQAIKYYMLSQIADSEMRYHYIRFWMKYYELSLEMEHILYDFGVEPDFDWFEVFQRRLA